MDGDLHVDRWHLRGANAEIVSVLRASQSWGTLLTEADWVQIAQTLDTRTPADERVTLAMNVLRNIQRQDPVARWLPRFDRLPEHEFRQEFHPAYRDHSIHTLQMWLLGFYFFETVSGLREPLVSLLRSRSASDRDTATLFRRWWTPTALWHDTGYPFESDELASTTNESLERLKHIAAALSADAFQDGLRGIGIDLSATILGQFHRAGRHIPFVFESVADFLENSDDRRIVDGMWRRLGLSLKPDERAERALDDFTIRAATGRSPYHDHGTFGALLLLRGCTSADEFLSELTSALEDKRFRGLSDSLSKPIKDKLEESYLEFLDSRPMFDMAAEAIAYHNFNFNSVHRPALNEVLGPNGSRPSASIKHEPHLVFLAIADTLQDWDRHHFQPQAGQHRPAVNSDQMLLQGYEGKIRIALDGHSEAAKRLLPLFAGWIEGVGELLADGAQFSRRNDIQSSKLAPTISAVEDSAIKLGQLRQEIASAVGRARIALTRNQPRAIIEAAEVLEPILRRATKTRHTLTQAHQNDLDAALRSPELQGVERNAVVVIQPGTLLPIGTVESRIGGGGFGEVYLVNDTTRGGTRKVAFKVFHGFELDNLTKRFYFERGFRAMESLRYEKGVVHVDRLLHVPFGMSMEYVEGMNLEEATKERHDIHVRLRLLERISETLASAHNKGIIHRDVKPANVLLDSHKDGEPVLTDFDLAHISGKTTVASAYFASQLYGAPEQFNKRLEEWAKKPCVDVYGFGALMYHVLTFRDPPLSGTFNAEQWGVVKQSLENSLPATVVNHLVTLLTDITQSDPRQRLESIEELQQMEHVVRVLAACRRDSAGTGQERIAWTDWVREVAYTVNSDAGHDNVQEFHSRSDGTTWRLETRSDGSRVVAMCTLNRDPRFEGVNYKGFSRSSARQVDRALEVFGKVGRSFRAKRHGQLYSAGSQMDIEILQLELTRNFARQVGDLLSALARAVE